jgi:peptide/nickel transport system ATP-binding protein
MFFERFPHEISGGQRQRVAIAGALALGPDLLVADEPVSALDASVKGEILQLLLRLRKELNLAVMVITHDLGLAWAIADRIAIMYLGRIVEIGPTEEVLGNPRHPYTEALLSVVPEGSGTRRVILAGEAPDPTRIPEGCRFHPRCPLFADSTDDNLRERCLGQDPMLAPLAETHEAACHAIELSPPAERQPSRGPD